MNEFSRGLRLTLKASATFLIVFAFTAPWRVGGIELGRFSIIAAAVIAVVMTAVAVNQSWRESLRSWIERADFAPSRRVLLSALFLVFLFLLKVVLSTWFALEVNAWDFSLYYDLPLERTLHGQFLFSEFLGTSTLANHAGYIVLAFLPLYGIASTPYWLLTATAFAVAAAAAAGFCLFRASGADPFVAAVLSLSFVMNPYTVRAVRYGFHPEIFYPLAVFLLLLAMLQKRPALYALGLVIAMAIKEDAIVVLTGVALIALIRRQWRWAAASFFIGVVTYAVDVFVVMPYFGAHAPGNLWYLGYWRSFGSTPVEVILGAFSDPSGVLQKLFTSGVFRLLLSVLFLPLLAPAWLVGALPALVLYGIADFEKLSSFALYYSMPVLPFLYAALPEALKRLASVMARRPMSQFADLGRFRIRIAALVLSLWSAMLASHTFQAPRPEAREVRAAAQSAEPALRVVVQGSLLPHAGYQRTLRVLDRSDTLGADAYLIHPGANPYPLSKAELISLAHRLGRDDRYRLRASASGLLLFEPIAPPVKR